jgi:hypothetical protein
MNYFDVLERAKDKVRFAMDIENERAFLGMMMATARWKWDGPDL